MPDDTADTMYERAFAEVMSHEGLGQHTTNPYDRGGETYSGISRLWGPEWGGWKLRDEGVAPDDSRLIDATINFYLGAFWLPLRCPDMSYKIATEVFDTAIHTSKRESSEIFQLSLNILNRQGSTYDDVKVDGHIGNQTMVAYRLLFREEPDEVNLFKTLNVMQGAHYVATVRNLPRQEMNYRGWLTRVVFTHDGRTS